MNPSLSLVRVDRAGCTRSDSQKSPSLLHFEVDRVGYRHFDFLKNLFLSHFGVDHGRYTRSGSWRNSLGQLSHYEMRMY